MPRAGCRAECRASPSRADRVSVTLFLLIRLGADRYALEAAQVVEVVPLVRLKELPGAPEGVAGVMNFRTDAVPVIDLNQLAANVATAQMLSSRIVVVRHAPSNELLGLLVPEATEAVDLDRERFVDAGVATDGAPYLGPVLTTPEGVIQLVTVSALLTAELRDALFRAVDVA